MVRGDVEGAFTAWASRVFPLQNKAPPAVTVSNAVAKTANHETNSLLSVPVEKQITLKDQR